MYKAILKQMARNLRDMSKDEENKYINLKEEFSMGVHWGKSCAYMELAQELEKELERILKNNG